MTPRIAITLVILAVLLAWLSIHRLYFADTPGPYLAFSGHTMGTTWEVKVARADLSPDAMRAIGATIDDSLARVDAALSTWRADSEISRFNADTTTEPFAAGPDLLAVVEAAEAVSRATGGAFDITVGPLVEAWGFGRAASELDVEPPSPEALERLRSRVGWQSIEVDRARGTLRKRRPDIELDVSAIAKGYGVDAIAAALEQLGYQNYLVEIGGELRARGRRLDGTPFRVAIEEPDPQVRRIHRVIEIGDASMATSGDYRSWREIDGVRVSHTLDPRVGRPIEHGLASVTVLQPSAMWADAWATALSVVGPEAGLVLARNRDMPAYFIVHTAGGGFDTIETPAFTARYGADAPPAASK